MSERTKIMLNDSLQDVLVMMAEGNPGAIVVLMQLAKKEFSLVLHLDDMNIRGSQIWVAFKDHCGENIELLAKKIQDRDAELVRTVNMCRDCGEEVAVTSGASFA